MPMTKRQLAQIEKDYNGLIPPTWHAVACEMRWISDHELKGGVTCAICGDPFVDDDGNLIRSSKRLTFLPNARLELTHVSFLACRNGVSCRRRRAERDARLAGINSRALRAVAS